MNKFVLLPIFLFLFFNAKAQDRIISINHDTIYCSITSINNERILYEIKNKNGSVTGKFMNLSQVAEYTRSPQVKPNSEACKIKTSKHVDVPENLWRLGLNIGRSTMPWYFDNFEPMSAMQDYYDKLKTGFHVNASAHYMINSSIGVGAEYSFFNTNFSDDIPTEYSTSIFYMVSEKYNEYIHYVGPSALFVQYLDIRRKFILTESLSAGALFIRLEEQSTYPNLYSSGYTDVTSNSLLTGNTLSAKLGLNAEYKLLPHVSVGVGGSFIWASLKKANIESRASNNSSSSAYNQELTNAFNLSRIDYSLVLRYQF
ncbi:MAG: hypothetical protein H6Q20_375 [Bacteroidetes bacterium]|nr:hypothetical protein [Bacteroidota bacterium]